MRAAQIKYLQAVDGHLFYRRRVPQDLKSYLGKTEWVHALGLAAGQEPHAAKIVADYNLAYASLIAQLRISQVTGTKVQFAHAASPIIPQAQEQPAPPAAPAEPFQPNIPISEAYTYDRNTHGASRNEKVFQVAVESVIALIGDMDIMTMTPKDVQNWINKCQERGQKTSTVQRRINALRAMLNRYYRDHEIEKRNPFSNPQLKEASGSKNDRLPFNKDHLKRIEHYFTHNERIGDEMRHILALMKLTGGRPLEIGGMDASDVFLDHAVPHIWIRNNPYRRVKTKGSERRIPLIGDALEAARAAKIGKNDGALFSRGCHDTNSLSQRMNKLIRRSGIPKSPRLVAYSLRHTLEEALRSAGVREHTQKRIMGHTDTSITGRYGAPAGLLEELQQALRNAEPLLGKVDITIYSNSERIST